MQGFQVKRVHIYVDDQGELPAGWMQLHQDNVSSLMSGHTVRTKGSTILSSSQSKAPLLVIRTDVKPYSDGCRPNRTEFEMPREHLSSVCMSGPVAGGTHQVLETDDPSSTAV